MSGATATISTSDSWLVANSSGIGNLGLTAGDMTWTNWNGPSAGYTTNAYNLTTALNMA